MEELMIIITSFFIFGYIAYCIGALSIALEYEYSPYHNDALGTILYILIVVGFFLNCLGLFFVEPVYFLITFLLGFVHYGTKFYCSYKEKQDKASKHNEKILYDPEDDELRLLKKRLKDYICE